MNEIIATLLTIAAFIALVGIAAHSVRRIVNVGVSTTDVVVAAHCIIAALPIALDWTIGLPRYAPFPGLRQALVDPLTNSCYAIYMPLFPLILLAARKKLKNANSNRWRDTGRRLEAELVSLRPLMWLTICGPLVYFVACAPRYREFMRYAVVVDSVFNADETAFYGNLVALTYPAIIAGAGLILASRRLASVILAAPFLSFAVYINGKRNIVFLALLCLLIALIMSNRLRGWRLAATVLIVGSGYAVFNQWYQDSYRHYLESVGRTYDSVRMDWGRDGDIKLALYTELYLNDFPVLEYRGQSFLFNVCFFVPRVWWPEKPRPYSYYITARALRIGYTQLRWGLTTSMLGEAVANLGWLGVLIAPALFVVVCRIGDFAQSLTFGLTTTGVGVLLLMLTIGNFLPVLGVWVTLGIISVARQSVSKKKLGLSGQRVEWVGVSESEANAL